MNESPANNGQELSFEVFAAKDSDGDFTGLMMSVPVRCGLKQADTLRINGEVAVAMRKGTVLAVNLPIFSKTICTQFAVLAQSGQRLAVAEFLALGLFDSYFLNVEIVS